MERRAREQASGAGAKFETFPMACGSIEDFHKGIQERIGVLPAILFIRFSFIACIFFINLLFFLELQAFRIQTSKRA